MALSEAQLAARRGKLTASRVAALMSGDSQRISHLYREMVGEAEPEDLSGIWAVALGAFTEPFHLDWLERKYGPLTRRGEVVVSAEYDWAAATLDAWSDSRACPFEAKHTGGFEPFEIIVARYFAQTHWQMIVTGARQCALSVILGAKEPTVEFIDFDEEYAGELMRRAIDFMERVRLRQPPPSQEPLEPPVVSKTYDFTGNNTWANEAFDYLRTLEDKRKNESAASALKSLVPGDAKLVTGHGVSITRDRANRLSLRELTEK